MLATFALAALPLLPRPQSVVVGSCTRAVPSAAVFDRGTREEIAERWRALGIVPLRGENVRVRIDPAIGRQAYRLTVDAHGTAVAAGDADGAFYAAMTLAQLPVRGPDGWRIPCVRIADAPQLRWRVLSDDVSRGPLPTMRYFEERIRTIAAFKMNGYSPYMEHVFTSPTDPLPAPLDGITPAQLHELKAYAARFHVTLIPEQQTFAHMHNTLRVEQYAPAADFPHGFLISPESAAGQAYLRRIISQERAALGDVPFFHIGSDETSTLGKGTTENYVRANGGRSAVYAAHVRDMAKLVAPARVLLWNDGIENDHSIMKAIPKNAVIVNWHYDSRASFMPFIRTIASGGFDQMVAPGANNWNEIFPDLKTALPNERRFITEGISAHVFGLFQTVWHDDGETLYESTWYPVLYAAATAWGGGEAADAVPSAFAWAFFGTHDDGFTNDELTLGGMDARFPGPSDKRFWGDPFDAWDASRMAGVDLRSLRLAAEDVETHLMRSRSPLHQNAAEVMLLAARRYDALGRRYQIATEVRAYYDDAKAHSDDAERDLFWCKYWFWEQRDTDEMLAPLYARAWRYESREGHLASNLERYHLDAQRAIERADAIDRVTYESYERTKTLPPLESIIK